ncbi:MAG: endopeptidase La [Eubacteriales bacterium]|nr:endopeptidase La [Eubacteriales bacterium]
MTVFPVYNILVVPDASIYIKTETYQKVTGKAPVPDEKLVVLVAKEDLRREDFKEDSFYPIGLRAVITEVNANGFLMLRTSTRVNLDDVAVYSDHTIDLSLSRRPDIDDLDHEDAQRRLRAVKSAMIQFAEGFQWGQAARAFITQWNSIGEAAVVMSPWMVNTNAERYAVLAEDSLSRRTEMLEKLIYENLEMGKVNREAESAQEQDHQKIYRESAIRKQMEYLQRELDEMHPENVTDLRKLEIKIEESGMNETARKEADKVLSRLKHEGQGAESALLYDYLDFLAGLPWKKETARDISLDEAARILDEDHYGLRKVKERIIQQLAVMSLKKRQAGSILLFVGAPGTGKTSIGQSIARALQREYVRVSLGGVRDEADIRGHRRTYIGAMPGRILDGIQKCGVSNPVMVLDEVDKLYGSYNGDPASALLEVLDPEQNSTFTDHYLNVPFDLSDVLFICTANSLDSIPEPLLNRMEVIPFQGYTPIEKEQIARRHLLPKAMQAVGLAPEQLTVTDGALAAIIADYTREGGVRGLKKRLETLCRTEAVKLVRGESESLTVTEDNLRDVLDDHPLPHRLVPESARPGVVTGLAWTQAGGEILYIETMFTRGSGKLLITGQLGEVMKESAQIAVSLVKSLYPEQAELFEKNDLHIHVPDGATPKDGPSAGITLTTALASLLCGKSVDPHVGMTGEVSLRGGVNPIGGLPEKLMAAQRAGVRQVFIPAENEEDLRDVAEEVRATLSITPVHDVTEVLSALGLAPKKPSPRPRRAKNDARPVPLGV